MIVSFEILEAEPRFAFHIPAFWSARFSPQRRIFQLITP